MQHSNTEAHLSLVGAGPGDPELISVRGLKAIRRARVIFYDALVHPDLVEEATGAIKIFVGKRCGKHSVRQEDINHLLVSHALQYGRVVRLKGGDPFVFGRGQEEIEYARAFGIRTELIPGISSAIAVPGLAGIPLTHRGLSESFWVITGTTRKHQMSEDLVLAAQSSATVVILMGTRKLGAIAELFLRYRSATECVALLEKGSLPDSRTISGQLQHICEKADAAGFRAPGIIVIGPVAGLASSEMGEIGDEETKRWGDGGNMSHPNF